MSNKKGPWQLASAGGGMASMTRVIAGFPAAAEMMEASWGVQRVTVRGSACPQVETYFEVGGE